MQNASQHLVTSLSAGLVAGLRTILGSAGMVVLVMPGGLAGSVAPGLEVILIGGAVLGALVALLGSYPGAVAQVQDGPAVIIGVMATALAAKLRGHVPAETIVLLVLACVNAAAFLTGAVFYALGRFRLAALVRFIPFPVIGGFLAGSGLLIVQGAIAVLAGRPASALTVAELSDPLRLASWGPGLGFGLLLVLLMRRMSHPLLMPGLLLGVALLYDIVLIMAGFDISGAQSAGLLLGPFPEHTGLSLPPWSLLPAASIPIVLSQLPTFAAVILVSVVALLLNASGLELATRSDLDLNRELRATGIANMASGFLGGAVGFQALSATLLGYRMGANSRIIGLTAALMCLVALLLGSSLFAFMPKAVLGGLLFAMGAGLLIEWLYDGWRKLPRADFIIVALIVAVIGGFGILPGVAVGISVATAIFVLSYSRVRVIRQELSGADYRSNVERSPAASRILKAEGGSIRVIKLEGYVFFGTAYTVLNKIQQIIANPGPVPLRFLILDFRDVPASDSSAMLAFIKIRSTCEQNRCQMLLTRMNPAIASQARQAGLDTGTNRLIAFSELDAALEHCEDEILSAHDGDDLQERSSIWDRIGKVSADGAELSRFMSYLEPRQFQPGEYLVTQGGAPTEIIFIESGRVSVHLTLADGRSVRLRSMTVGTMIGEIGMYLQQPRTASARADSETRAYVLRAERLRQMEQEDPQLATALHRAILSLLAERLAATNSLLERIID